MFHRLGAGLAAGATFLSGAAAQDLGGGAPANHGRVPRFELTSWIPGQPSELLFRDLPAGVAGGAAIVSAGQTNLIVPGVAGNLLADPFAGVVVAMGGSVRVPVPMVLSGRSLVIQGLVADLGAGLSFTDATRAHLFRPTCMVGNQRQSSNSVSVIDLVTQSVVQRLGNSENGSITFSLDRTRAYVCEPGLQRDRVVVYDLTSNPIGVLTTVGTTGGIRYRGEPSPDGLRLYVPIHNGVDVIDTNPNSPTYHTVVATIPTPITGNAGTIFTGPIDVAVTPDGSRLFIAYGENLPTWPAPATVGVVDLLVPGFPHRSIPVRAGGVVTLLGNLATRTSVRVSPDGAFAYVLEFGFKPGSFAQGFQRGGLLNVIDVASETEVATIATDGFAQSEMELDYLGRNLWVPQTDVNDYGEVLRIDVDRRSAGRNTLVGRIAVDPTNPYAATTGPRGAATTPDGSRLAVSVVEDGSHPTPQLQIYEVATGQQIGAITVESLPATTSIQR